VFIRDNVGDWDGEEFLQAFNAEAGDQFGFSVALSGDTLAVGAVGKDSEDLNIPPNPIDKAGAAYVFQ
jgi:hypothetical protein